MHFRGLDSRELPSTAAKTTTVVYLVIKQGSVGDRVATQF